MLRFLVWKTSRLLHVFKREGSSNAFGFVFNKVGDKIADYRNFALRRWQEKHLKEEFTSLWQAHVKKDNRKRVLLLVSSFFDLDGKIFMQGGAERYIIELNRIITALGGRLEVYQCGRANWHNTIHDISVFGLNTNGNNLYLLNRSFHSWVPAGCLTIYFQMLLSTPRCNTPSICVSHGIDWDAHWLQSNKSKYRSTIENILSSINNVNRLVSVDTNTINWLRATNTTLAKKCVYIPNFVDVQQFRSAEKEQEEDLVILYPRRLSEARGFWLLAEIIPKLLEEWPNIKFHFCGIAESYEKIEITNLCNRYAGRVCWYDLPPDQMPSAYRRADIVLVPTLYSEGTSLSCIEALASRKAVIATNVGGLPNIILPGYNGLLIEPDKECLYNAICCLIEDSVLRENLAENGFKTAQVFNIDIWKQRWEFELKPYLGLD